MPRHIVTALQERLFVYGRGNDAMHLTSQGEFRGAFYCPPSKVSSDLCGVVRIPVANGLVDGERQTARADYDRLDGVLWDKSSEGALYDFRSDAARITQRNRQAHRRAVRYRHAISR
jgi:hypothetical protein